MRPTPFNKILVANRGEIALRIMRTARSLGYRTVAVYSSADRLARHVREADQAVLIGEPLPVQSYLNIAAIVDAAKLSGADAVHPGYGFLAENANFAQACIDAGLVFIGPSPQSIISMGNKAGAKELMIAAGVPCVPGYQGSNQNEAVLQAEAGKIGYPVMIKATAGGGGRGMRLVATPAHFIDALRSAKSEAQSAFGNPEVILERAIVEPRHIEIQVFGDRYGNAIHLGERDCSVQRRHQKVIEEAPSPAVGPELRQRMGATAVAAVKAIGYEGAGTFEFLLDSRGEYYFMEMNTRLQVEHPVTEAITGLDLVELQLRVASGEALPISQDQVELRGHAIEVRLCAEDVQGGFMPQSGTMLRWDMPQAARAEHGLESGAAIPPYYDSMIAKLICHGSTRVEARRKLAAALDDTVALGVRTNQKFLSACLRHPVFAEGGATTGFIASHSAQLLKVDESAAGRARAISAVLLYSSARSEANSSIAHHLPIGFRFSFNGNVCNTLLTHEDGDSYLVELDEMTHAVSVLSIDSGRLRFSCDGLVEGAVFCRDANLLYLHYEGESYHIDDQTHVAETAHVGDGGDGKIKASMNGRVVAIHVLDGAPVRAGEAILTLEAMKMEHIHHAPVSGVITLKAALGDQVAVYRIVAEIMAPLQEGK
jgi:geranyl-CoA carboxylase alpha subunit